MTLKEKVKEVDPISINEECYGNVSGCPNTYEFLQNQTKLCVDKISPSGVRCTRCWNQEFKESEKVMTKSDLKTGMVTENRNGSRRFVLNDDLIDSDGFTSLFHYTDNLTMLDSNSEDIVKVYTTKGQYFEELFKDGNLTVLWERKAEPKKMTVAEISKELGYEIEIVK